MSHKECEHPEHKPKDGKCREEQIRECHGPGEKHPYEETKEKK